MKALEIGGWVVATSRTGHRYIGRVVEERIETLPTIVHLWPVFEVVLLPTATGGVREVPSSQTGAMGPQYVHAHDLLPIDPAYSHRMLDAAGIEWKKEYEEEARHARPN